MITTRIFAAVALAGAMTMPALAQDSDAPMTTTPPAASTEVSDELVSSFVAAALNVAEVAEEYQPLIETAEDATQRDALVEQAQVAMATAVESTEGITVEEYMAISSAAQSDPELNARLEAELASES